MVENYPDTMKPTELKPLKRTGSGFWDTLFFSREERINKIQKGLSEYKPNYLDAFYQEGQEAGNMLISGGNAQTRMAALCAQIRAALDCRQAVVVLHEGDRQLQDTLRFHFSGDARYEEVSWERPYFEPVYGLNSVELTNEILEITPKAFGMQYSVKYYLDGVTDLIRAMGRSMSFRMLSTCPHTRIFDLVDEQEMKGRLSDTKSQEIRSKLMMGQTENMKLDSLLGNMEMEMSSILWKRESGHAPVGIADSVMKGKLLVMDLLALSNEILPNLILFQLKLAMMRGRSYALVLDSFSGGLNENFKKFIQANSHKVALTVVSEDLYALACGDERFFDTLVGNSGFSVILRHRSAQSAKKWAEVIGQYDAWIASYSTNQGSHSNPHDIFNSYSSGRGTSVSKNREYKVKPEQITQMGETEAYVLSVMRSEVAHLQLIV